MPVACEPLETQAGLWIFTPPSALQPNFLLPHARHFVVQQHMRLTTGLFLTSIPLLILSLLLLMLSFTDPYTFSRIHSPGKSSPTLLASIRLCQLNFLCASRAHAVLISVIALGRTTRQGSVSGVFS